MGQPVYLLVISVSDLCYQPSRQDCLHLDIIFRFVAVRILLFHRKHDNLRSVNSPDMTTIVVGYLVTKSFGV